MKYWIFQSNQVLGPYEPDDLSRHSAFGAESLVCPEGRRGTSMGDWQRAGMVPDLSVALVRASQAHNVQSSVATLAGLPPEPTLKDLAVLGNLQEKMAMMEDVVLQLQEGLRAKDAELAALQQELAGKDRQSSVMKAAMEHEAEDLKRETQERKREAEDLQAQVSEFKRKMAELEDRVGVVNRLSETIDKAVEAEKNVEHDVQAQGAALSELTKEIEALRVGLTGRLSGVAPAPREMPPIAPEPASREMPSIAPAPASFSEPPKPDISIDVPLEPTPAPIPAPLPVLESVAAPPASSFPAFDGGAVSSFRLDAPEDAMTIPLDPTSAVPEEAPEPIPAGVDMVAAPAPKSRKKALIFGGLFGLVVLGAFAFVSGRMGPKKAAVSAAPPPPQVPPTPLPPVPAIDPREAAIQAAKEWALPGGRTLGQVLETLSPPIGNLSPWMAEPLSEDRVSVNYFAHGGGSGAPTVAYEFEVDLGAKSVVGRNPAAKAVIAGKAAAPPAPPKPKRVKLKPKVQASAAADELAAPADKPAKPTAAKRAAKAAAQSAPPAKSGKAADETLLDDILKE